MLTEGRISGNNCSFDQKAWHVVLYGRYIAGKENTFGETEKGMATDKVDQFLLILAYVNKAFLATQERTMTSIGKKTLPIGRILRFEDLVLDLLLLGSLSKSDIEIGLSSLDHFNETLDSEKRKTIENFNR